MSKALLRRNSSKQGLQNLMRLTAQRSIEDAEEAERERRRRLRDASRWSNGGRSASEESADAELLAEENNDHLKPRSSPSLEEDEGFSDWTQRRQRKRQQMEELRNGEQQEAKEAEELVEIPTPSPSSTSTSTSSSSSGRLQEPESEVQDKGTRVGRGSRDPWKGVQEENRKVETQVERGQEPNEFSHQESITSKDVKSHKTNSNKLFPRSSEPERMEATRETEQCLEKIRQGLHQKESQGLEQLRQHQPEAEQELEELQRRREERRRLRVEDEQRREEEECQRLAREEEEKRRMKKDIETRRMKAAERMKSMSSAEGDENFCPLSPRASAHKLTERTESLNRSLKKSNSFKKTVPLVMVPKIDDKVEQYVHAVENSQEQRSQKLPSSELLASPVVIVTAKKNLFEAGEAGIQSPSRPPGCKDTDGLKVGVANLITQWVKGPSDSSRQSAVGRPADVKPGDVMQKKNMWEGIGDTPFSQQGAKAKGSVSKKYKFVITGHGKYEKVATEDSVTDGNSGSLQDS